MKTSKRLTAILLAGFMSLIMVPYASATQNDLAIPEDVVRSMEANNVELLDWSEVPEGIVPMEFDTWEEALAYLEEFSAVPQHQ